MITKEISVKQGFTSKKCPKCGGSTFIDKDIYGWNEQCLQCGKSFELPDVVDFFKHEIRMKQSLPRSLNIKIRAISK